VIERTARKQEPIQAQTTATGEKKHCCTLLDLLRKRHVSDRLAESKV